MKLRTIMELKEGMYRDKDIDNTISMCISRLLIFFSTMLFALVSLHCPDFRKALLFFVLYFISMLLLIVLCIYFACCELYENKIDKINETEQMCE